MDSNEHSGGFIQEGIGKRATLESCVTSWVLVLDFLVRSEKNSNCFATPVYILAESSTVFLASDFIL